MNSLGQLLDVSTVDTDGVADMIYVLHSGAWDHLWENYVSEYNPIWNIDGVTIDKETRDLTKKYTGTDTNVRSGNEKYTQEGTDEFKKDGDDTIKREGTNQNDNTYFGFDSVSDVPTTSQVQTPDLTDKTTYNSKNTETKDLTDTKTYNNVQDQQTKDLQDKDIGTVEHKITRQGNQGVTMTSQMLRDDTDYWSDIKSLFYEHVIKDIVGDICYKIYVESEF